MFGAAKVELQVVLFGETDATMDLVCGSTDAATGIAGPGLGHRDFLARCDAIGQTPGGTIGDEARAVDVNDHIGTLMFDGLKAADRPTELDPILGVIHRHIEGHLRYADHLRAFGYCGVVKCPLQQRPTLVQLAEESFSTDLDVPKFHLELSVR